MSSGLEDLTKHVLSDPRVESSHIQSALVGLGSRATGHIARLAAGRGHGVARHGGANGRGNGVVVLRDDDGGERRGRHVLLGLRLVVVAGRTAGGGRRGELCPRVLLVGHGGRENALKAETGRRGADEQRAVVVVSGSAKNPRVSSDATRKDDCREQDRNRQGHAAGGRVVAGRRGGWWVG